MNFGIKFAAAPAAAATAAAEFFFCVDFGVKLAAAAAAAYTAYTACFTVCGGCSWVTHYVMPYLFSRPLRRIAGPPSTCRGAERHEVRILQSLHPC